MKESSEIICLYVNAMELKYWIKCLNEFMNQLPHGRIFWRLAANVIMHVHGIDLDVSGCALLLNDFIHTFALLLLGQRYDYTCE